ncbi:MAG: LamG domain-containing protein [Chthoniobacterales bacterium]
MKNKYCTLLSLALGLLAAFPIHSLAADPGIYYYFEDNSDPTMPINSGDGPFNFHYLGDTLQTTTQAKFGKGSMLIGEKKGDALYINHGNGFASQQSEFSDGIEKMTITAWVRPANPPEGRNSFYPGFWIFGRLSGNDGWGPGHFTFGFAYDKLQFTYYSDGGQKQTFNSSPIKYVESEEWTHVGMTFDQGKIVFYFNGLPIGDADGTPVKATNISQVDGKSILIGFSNNHKGDCIDDFGFLVGRALTESEIDTVYNKGLQEFVKGTAAKAAPAKAPVKK